MTMNHIDREQYIYGVRAVIEAIEAGKEIDKIYVSRDARSELVDELLAKAREANLLVARVPVQRIDRITRKNHQGVVALLAAVTYYSLDQLVPMLYDNGDNPLIVVLDGITDVRNFGAIARTCECAGVNAIVIPERNSVTVNADAVKTSAGAPRVPRARCGGGGALSARLRLQDCGNGRTGLHASHRSRLHRASGHCAGRRRHRHFTASDALVRHTGAHS